MNAVKNWRQVKARVAALEMEQKSTTHMKDAKIREKDLVLMLIETLKTKERKVADKKQERKTMKRMEAKERKAEKKALLRFAIVCPKCDEENCRCIRHPPIVPDTETLQAEEAEEKAENAGGPSISEESEEQAMKSETNAEKRLNWYILPVDGHGMKESASWMYCDNAIDACMVYEKLHGYPLRDYDFRGWSMSRFQKKCFQLKNSKEQGTFIVCKMCQSRLLWNYTVRAHFRSRAHRQRWSFSVK